MKVFLSLAALLWASVAGAEPVLKAFAGVNGVWYQSESAALPSDFEVGANLRASLSPHISGTGALYYGVNRSYVRGSVGPRFTITDVLDQNFSIGLGLSYHFSSEASIRPEEWAPDVSVGWRPWPLAPKVILVAQSSYGLDTNQLAILAGVRYAFWQGGGQ